MNNLKWKEITTIFGYVGLGISLITNGTLLYILYLKSGAMKGSYKYLLAFVSVFLIFYSLIELLLEPLIHMYDNTLFVIHRKKIDLSPPIARLIPSTYCGCYAMSFTLFALQFIYRYIATCKQKYYDLFQNHRFKYWIIGSFLVSLSWSTAAYLLFPKSQRTENAFLEIIENYGLDKYWTDYVPYGYFNYIGATRVYNISCLLGLFHHVSVISISFIICVYCGINTFKSIKKNRGRSNKTRKLQLQFFRALVLQSAIPLFIVYFPTAYIFVCPFFTDSMGSSTNYQVIICQLYPGLDPLILLFVIDDFRNTFYRIIFQKRNVVASTSTTMTMEYVSNITAIRHAL